MRTLYATEQSAPPAVCSRVGQEALDLLFTLAFQELEVLSAVCFPFITPLNRQNAHELHRWSSLSIAMLSCLPDGECWPTRLHLGEQRH